MTELNPGARPDRQASLPEVESVIAQVNGSSGKTANGQEERSLRAIPGLRIGTSVDPSGADFQPAAVREPSAGLPHRIADLPFRPTPPTPFSRETYVGPGPVGGTGKRAFDIVASGLALLAVLPLLAFLVLVVKVGIGGPVFYSHRRVGFNGRVFSCVKLTTMCGQGEQVLAQHLARNPDAAREWRETRKLTNDPRVSRLGSLLRKTSLDELPQLLNVLKGDMSMIGPRPVTAEELALYGADADHYVRARPGLTGLWQVSGRNRLSFPRRVSLDSTYVQTWSPRLDLWILAQTLPAMWRHHETS